MLGDGELANPPDIIEVASAVRTTPPLASLGLSI